MNEYNGDSISSYEWDCAEIEELKEKAMAKYTEWCPECDAETDYNENKPLICSGCGISLLPCDACLHDRECLDCPYE